MTIVIAAILNLDYVRESFFWHLTYTSNIYLAIRESFAAPVTHLWSLSVEEQFYLFWLCIILFVPRKHLLKVLFATVVISLFYRLLSLVIGLSLFQIHYLTLGVLDSFGMGAILALSKYEHRFKKSIKSL